MVSVRVPSHFKSSLKPCIAFLVFLHTDRRTAILETMCALVLLVLWTGQNCRLWVRSGILKARRCFVWNGNKMWNCNPETNRLPIWQKMSSSGVDKKWQQERAVCSASCNASAPVLSPVTALQRALLSAHWRLTGCRPRARSRGLRDLRLVPRCEWDLRSLGISRSVEW